METSVVPGDMILTRSHLSRCSTVVVAGGVHVVSPSSVESRDGSHVVWDSSAALRSRTAVNYSSYTRSQCIW